MAEPIINVLGTVAMKTRGEYDSETSYEKLNVVTYEGSSYCAKMATQGNLPTDTDFWDLIAEKGDKGDMPTKGVDYWTASDKSEIEADLSSDVTSEVTEQLSDLTSATPLVAEQLSDMTETDRIYVLTTDGHWYWYDGDSWEDGGVYQSTGIADKSVIYTSLSDNLKERAYKELSIEDIPIRKNLTWNNGVPTDNPSQLSTPAIKVSKNTHIIISDVFKGRLTFWDEKYNYISNTGTLDVLPDTLVQQDGFAAISISNNVEGQETVDYDDINSTNIKVIGLKNKEYDFVEKAIEYTLSGKKAISNFLPVGKGTVIKIVGANVKKSTGDDNTTYPIFKSVACYDFDKNIIGTASSFNKADYTVEQDCYIKITVGLSGNTSLISEDVSLFKNAIDIDYKYPTTPFTSDESASDSNVYNVYIGSDGNIELYSPSPETAGASLFKLDNNLTIAKNNTTVISLSMAELIELFPSSVETFRNEQWIKLTNRTVFSYNKETEEVEIKAWSNLNSKKDYILLANAYQNYCGGALYEIWLKFITKDIFNSAPYNKSIDWRIKVAEFNALMNTDSKVETFLFFTDQHILGNSGNEPQANMNSAIATLQKYYNSCPLNFIISGGDWLNHGDTDDQACYKLGYVEGFMNSMFKNFHQIVGNHDTNYQGTVQLSQQTLNNLWFRKEEGNRSYYSFDGTCSKNYVLDSGIDWGASSTMTDYHWEQVDWLANKLINDNPTHATVMTHMVWVSNSEHTLALFADNVTKLLNAFNTHTTITLNNISYDFSDKTGHVDYVICGHIHDDYIATVNDIPCVGTINFNKTYPSFDLVCNDYDNHKVRMIRVGTGENREFDI